MHKGVGLVLVLGLSACGSNSGGSKPQGFNSYAVESEYDLPLCETDRVGQLYYVESTQEFQVCKTTGWETINVKGADGDSVSSLLTCNATAGTPLSWFRYEIVTYSNGNRWVNCSITDTSGNNSASVFYKSIQSDSSSGKCMVTADLDGSASGGTWTFTDVSEVRTAIYDDSGSTDDGQTVTFSSCFTF